VTRFNPKAGAAALVSVALLYLAVQLATGRSARAEAPVDLTPRAADAALDVWKAAALLVEEPKAVLLDVRPVDAYARYHPPAAVSAPGADATAVARLAAGAPVVVYAGKDEVAQKVVAEARAAAPGARVYFLPDGARAWYLAFQLPVPLFAEAAPPAGYQEAVQAVNGWFSGAAAGDAARSADGGVERRRTVEALRTLAKVNYQPTLLKRGKKAAAAVGGRKISGGCG
jgi:rhodanese-related sulfurtransferase